MLLCGRAVAKEKEEKEKHEFIEGKYGRGLGSPIDREIGFYEFFSFLKFNEFNEFFFG